MKGYGIFLMAGLIAALLAGCRQTRPAPALVRVSVTSTAGPVLPALQWHEDFTMTPNKVTLARNGRAPETEVNAGAWDISVPPDQVAALFALLAAVDCAKIERVEPDDPPDGGSTESYTLTYADGTTCSLLYDPGTSYVHGEDVVVPVREFVSRLQLPTEAASRYK